MNRTLVRSVVSNETILRASSDAIFPFIKGFRRDLRLTKRVSSRTANHIRGSGLNTCISCLSFALPIILLFLFTLGSALEASARLDQIPTGTRPMGMAGAFLTVGGDRNTICWNPAAMPFVRHQDLGFSHHFPSDVLDITEDNLSYLFAITDRHAMGVDWFRTGFDDGEYKFGEDRFLLAYGYNPYKSLSFGIGLKYLIQDQTLDNTHSFDADGMGIDLGFMFSPMERLKLGIVALDATDTWMKFSWGARDKRYDRTLRYGVSYQPVDPWIIALDYDVGPHIGTEYWFGKTLAIRGGIYDNFQTDDGVRYAVGGSLKYRMFQLDYAFNTHPALPDSHRFSVNLAFELTPNLVRIEKIETQPVFCTLYQRYSTEPMGKVVLRNKRKKPLKVNVSVYLSEYMDDPTEIAQDVVLVGQTGDELAFADPIAIRPVLNDAVLTAKQNTPAQAEITVTYEYLSRTRTVQKSEMVTLYRPGILPLGDSVAPIAALIDPFDPVVESFARGIVSRYSGEHRMQLISKQISQAIQLYSALNGLGMKYVRDPDNPYGSTDIDSVKYPREMLALESTRTGDCDDASALYSALLENVGIHTMLVDIPGHVYVIFDTGIHSNNFERMCLPEEMYIIVDNAIWLPVEVTLYGKPFTEAWQKGMLEYQKWQEKGQLKLVDVHRAWEAGYNYNHPPGDAPDIGIPPGAKVDPYIESAITAIQNQRNEYLNSLEGHVDQELAGLTTANKLAMILAFQGRYDQATQRISAILDRSPNNASALNNLGNIYTMKGEIERAKAAYQSAYEADKTDPGIRLNQGLVHKISGDDEYGDQLLAEGIQKAGGAAKALNLIGIGADTDTRGEAALMIANQIRLLFTNLAGEQSGATKLLRASEVGDDGEEEFHLYWKR